jgi:murein DD-endopeptidase MepM/ murein hydrolase activator NlpD
MRLRGLIAVLSIALAAFGFAATPARAASAGVAALQVALRAEGLYRGTVDGVLGPGTVTAVRRLQARHRLTVDGIPGRRTRRALGRRGRPAYGSRVMTRGKRGWDVAALQFLLARQGFPSGRVDGGFGSHVDVALQRFQRWVGLPADGVAGPATLRALRRPVPRSPARLLVPVAATASDRFGPRGDRFHSGIDFPAPAGTTVRAAGRGCVSQAGPDGSSGYGNLVVVRHRFGLTSWYAHLDRITVRVGECVAAGERVGTVGSTGAATGPHLHFELRLRGATIDPFTAL